jgi:lysophospholipase L1-like esterase
MVALRLCFIGDSIVNGYGDDAMLGWPGRLCAAGRAAGHDLTSYNLGVRGDTSSLIRGRWRAEAAARLPAAFRAALVFSFGINDCVHLDGVQRVSPTESLANLGAILSEARSLGPTLFIGPTPIGQDAPTPQLLPGAQMTLRNRDIAALGASLVAAASRLGVPALDPFPVLVEDQGWQASLAAGDGIYPGAEGYAALAHLIAAWSAWPALLG